MYIPNGKMSKFVAEDLAQDHGNVPAKFHLQTNGTVFGCATAEAAGETFAEANPNHRWKVQNRPFVAKLSDPLVNVRAPLFNMRVPNRGV
jgi:hypothetical protein